MKKDFSEKELNEREHFDKVAQKYDYNYSYLNTFTKYKISKKSVVLKNFVRKYLTKKSHTANPKSVGKNLLSIFSTYLRS